MRILLLRIEKELTAKIVKHFKPCDCSIDVFTDASKVFDAIYEKIYDVVILTIEAPDFSALEITKQIRENKIRIPIILITKLLDFDYLKCGYEFGCSDYLREPFELEELRYRLFQSARHCHFDTDENILYLNDKFIYDLNKYQLSKNNLTINLTSKENKIIQYLVKRVCRCCTVEEIAEFLSEDKEVNCSTVRMHIKRIRDKCGKHLIKCIKGVGYRICRDIPE
ncbi:MAG: response regulator transcription factor [Sulfurospirillaceae bacterium]|nr:response regulator transcription factor [Sulfurospirillaceae bacterium]MDD2825718.1 response regulator transcription factor [Sulfurospirillaceae bacterium]